MFSIYWNSYSGCLWTFHLLLASCLIIESKSSFFLFFKILFYVFMHMFYMCMSMCVPWSTCAGQDSSWGLVLSFPHRVA